ncbi:unnamed protein product [Amoebophrya sp. A120]|nr:unnamed protein product [Amoebophrya sp. A120]|eukprot:GSA120T00017535001.1
MVSRPNPQQRGADATFAARFRDTFDIATPQGCCISVLQRRPEIRPLTTADEPEEQSCDGIISSENDAAANFSPPSEHLKSSESTERSSNTTTTAVQLLHTTRRTEDDPLDTGCTVWESAELLAQFLLHANFFEGYYYPNVLELGAGTGVCGLVAAAAVDCDSVVLTDLPQMQDLLQKNIARNSFLFSWNYHCGAQPEDAGSHGTGVRRLRRIENMTLAWGSRETTAAATPGENSTPVLHVDLCLCADLVYSPEHVALLLQTVADLFETNPNMYILFAQNPKHNPLAWRQMRRKLQEFYSVEDLWPAFWRGVRSEAQKNHLREKFSTSKMSGHDMLDLLGICMK